MGWTWLAVGRLSSPLGWRGRLEEVVVAKGTSLGVATVVEIMDRACSSIDTEALDEASPRNPRPP